VKSTSATRTNNRETERQLGEMDYVVFQVERIADELHESGISIPIPTRPLPQTSGIPQESEATTSKSSRKGVYLPQWLQDHQIDPAAMVTFALHQLIRH
jgi:hypothetical protein